MLFISCFNEINRGKFSVWFHFFNISVAIFINFPVHLKVMDSLLLDSRDLEKTLSITILYLKIKSAWLIMFSDIHILTKFLFACCTFTPRRGVQSILLYLWISPLRTCKFLLYVFLSCVISIYRFRIIISPWSKLLDPLSLWISLYIHSSASCVKVCFYSNVACSLFMGVYRVYCFPSFYF